MGQDRSISSGSAQPAPTRPAPPQSDSAQRREVRYSGRVQGVGFRYTTRAIAARLPIAGWVRNLPDGTVELVVEGAPEALDDLLAGIAGELGRFIEHCEIDMQPATGEFSSFEIAF